MLTAERLAAGAGAPAPVPESAMLCGLPASLSVMVTAPVRAPVAVGVNVTVMAQFAPAASDAPQVVVRAKSPVAAMPVMVRAALPVLETVTVCAALAVATCWLLNATLAADMLSTGAGAVGPSVILLTKLSNPAGLTLALRRCIAPVVVGKLVELV